MEFGTQFEAICSTVDKLHQTLLYKYSIKRGLFINIERERRGTNSPCVRRPGAVDFFGLQPLVSNDDKARPDTNRIRQYKYWKQRVLVRMKDLPGRFAFAEGILFIGPERIKNVSSNVRLRLEKN